MRNIWAVCKREFKSYFLTPVGYVLVGMVSVVTGMAFTISFLTFARITQSPGQYSYTTVPNFEETFLSPFLVFCGVLIMFLSPLITMRLLAEERHRGTIELLLTYPLRDREIIFGKYLAAMGMVLVMLLPVAVDVSIMAHFVKVEPLVLIFGILTVFLMSGAFISLGLFVSSLAHNQITSAVLTFGTVLIFYVVGNLGDDIPKVAPIPPSWPAAVGAVAVGGYNLFRGVVLEMSLDAHAKEMAQGIFQPRDVVYYLILTALCLFLTFRALESRNWKG